MKNWKLKLPLAFVAGLALLVPAFAQDSGRSRTVSGQKQKITGVIVKRDADSFILRDQNGSDTCGLWMLTCETELHGGLTQFK